MFGLILYISLNSENLHFNLKAKNVLLYLESLEYNFRKNIFLGLCITCKIINKILFFLNSISK